MGVARPSRFMSIYSGVSRISASGVLKVRSDTKSGGEGGGGGASGPIRNAGLRFGAQQIRYR